MTGIYPSAAQLGGNLADDSTGTGIHPLGSAFCDANPGSLKCANIINPSTGLPFPGNVIPSADLNPIDQLAIPFIPTPNVNVPQGGGSFPAFNTIGSPSITNTTDQYNARIDQTITSKDLLFATFSNYNSIILNPTLEPLGGSSLPIADHLWTVTYNHVFTPNLLNDFRLGLNNSVTFRNPVSAYGPNYAQTLFKLTNTNQNPLTFGVPDFGISGVSGIGSFTEVIGATQKNYQLTDNVSWSDGPHNIMAGVELIHERFNQNTDFGANPSFTFDGRFTGTQASGFGLGDFLLGIPFQATSAAGDSGQNLHTNYYGIYARDNWRVAPSFTFSYGLRYEYSLSPVESQNRQGYFDLTQGKEIYAGEGARRSIVKPDYTNFAPRIGFTWAPSFVHNAVLRGGFGLYYATDNWNELQFSIVGTKFYGVQTLNSDPTKPTLSTSNLFPPLSTSLNTNPFTLDPNSRTPYYQQWSLDFQKTFARNYLAEVEYAGNIGKHLPQRMNANVATIDPTGLIPIPDRVPFPDFGFILYSYNGGSSNWNALTAKIQRRFDNGLSFLAAFTYSNAIDQGITDDFSAISAEFKKYDRGHSDYTVPTRFVLSGTYDLPFGHGREFGNTVPTALNYAIGGWQINTITTLTAGQYGTATLPTDWLNIGAFSQSRPNVNWSLVKKGRRLPTQYLNPAAFSFPSTHIEGNVGRNTIALPGYGNIDFSLFKAFPAYRESFVQLRFEFFNLLNHTQFNGPGGSLGPGFGVITSDRGPRVIQLGARVQW